MSYTFVDTFVDPTDDQLVSFSVVCRPSSGFDFAKLREQLNLETLNACLPEKRTRDHVIEQLVDLGFNVFEEKETMNPVGCSRGTVKLFRSAFPGAKLKTLIRRVTEDSTTYTVTTVIREPGSPPPSPDPIDGAIYIAIATPPAFLEPRIPPPLPARAFSLRFPGDVAQILNAPRVHRKGYTGKGVVVAVLDSGCFAHPYYSDNDYDIKVVVAPDANNLNPVIDDTGHGTRIIANVFACAPDVSLLAVKMGDNDIVSIVKAMVSRPIPRIMSISWAHDLSGELTLPDDYVPLYLTILVVLASGVTVITAGGNGDIAFPGMMPEVIAVGGIAIDQTDTLSKWALSSSFVSAIFPGRAVPDFCGISSAIYRPTPPDALTGEVWRSGDGGTSAATPQVAGVAALLLEKKSTLTHFQIKKALGMCAFPLPGTIGRPGDSLLVDAFKTCESII